MIVINQRLLDTFSLKHASARKSIATWKKITEDVTWKKKLDILNSFPNAKILQNKRARFEIVHNKFRLIGEISFEQQIVEVRFIGSHTEYDRINPSTI